MTLHHPIHTNRSLLKDATRGVHEATEARWFSAGDFANREAYEQWLRAMSGVHETLAKPAVAHPTLAAYAPVEAERQSVLLLDIGDAQTETTSPIHGSEAWGWGVMYALHGSALGASMLLKSKSVGSGWPKAYLRLMAEFATSGQLKQFFDRLNAAQIEPVDMIRGATDVFTYLAAYR